MKFKCPSCSHPYTAYVDKSTCLKCTSCGKLIKPQENGKVEIVIESVNQHMIESQETLAYTPNNSTQTSATQTNVKTNTKTVVETEFKKQNSQPNFTTNNDSSNPIWPYIVGVLLVVAYYGWNDFLKPRLDTKRLDSNNHMAQNPPPQSPVYQTPPPTSTYQPPVSSPSQNNESDSNNATASGSGIVYLHTVNTYMGTDKSDKCNAVMDEVSKTMTLTSVAHPSNSFKLISRDGGVCTFQYFSNDSLQAEKTIYRRSDLETGNGTLIYTSRTGEITISLSY